MREQIKRLISAAAAICLLPGMTAAPYSGVPCYAVTASAAAASAAQYGQSAAFAAKVQQIEEGACGLYLDRDGTLPENPLAVGTALNKYQTYFVRTTSGDSWNGRQCYIYSQGVYSQLFDALPLNGTCDTASARTVLQGPAEITPDVLYEARVMPGAYLRTTANENGSFNGSAGHSLIILGYDESQITILEGNADGYGLIRRATMSYEEFAHQFTTGWGRTVTHIIQPDESVYITRYGMIFEDLPYHPATTAPAPAAAAPVTIVGKNSLNAEIPESIPPRTTAAAAVTTAAATKATTAAATTVTTAAATTAATTTVTTVTTAAATTVTAKAEIPETAAPVLQQPLPVSEPAPGLLSSVCTADPIRVTRKTTQIALFLPDAKSYVWSSSAPETAQVDENGKVTIRGNGRAVITAERGDLHYEFPILAQIVSWSELGDINLDGSADPSDAAFALSLYVESLVNSGQKTELTDVQFSRADVDDNGIVSIEDAQNILRFYVEYTLSGAGKSPMETWARLLNLD